MSDLDALLAEQVAYYRARAPEYSETAIPELPTGELTRTRDDLIAAFDKFRPRGHVLELACGPGTWTPELLRHADSVTAVDAAPEMLRIAAGKVRDEGAIRADRSLCLAAASTLRRRVLRLLALPRAAVTLR